MLQYYFLISEELTCNFLCIFYFLLNLVLDLLMMLWGPFQGLLRVLTVPQDLAQPPKFLGWIPDSFSWVLSRFISLLPLLHKCVKTPQLNVFCMWLVEPVSGRGFDPGVTPGPSMVYGVLRLGCSRFTGLPRNPREPRKPCKPRNRVIRQSLPFGFGSRVGVTHPVNRVYDGLILQLNLQYPVS